MAHEGKTADQLRKFGLTIAVPLLLIGGFLFWRGRAPWLYFVATAVLIALIALFRPRLLAPVERGWMALAHVLSVVMTYVVLTMAFYLIITPAGLLMRLFGKDPMQRKFEPERESYWIPVEPDGPGSRPDKPF